MEWCDQKKAELIDLYVYAGKDGEFNPEAWAKRLLQIDYDLRELKIQKTLIDAEQKELFTEAVVEETDVTAEIHD